MKVDISENTLDGIGCIDFECHVYVNLDIAG